jgi:signal transduction histidine kinase
VHAEAIAVASPTGSTQKFIATFLDVSQLRAAQADTLAALQRQKELNELRARFVAMASHEFRTPLATILSSAQLIKQYQDRLAAQDREELLQSVETGVQRMTAMLDRILLINKADAQMLEFQPERLDVVALCHAIVDEVEQQTGSPPPGVDRQFALAEPWGDYDPKLLHHILGNLLSNAIKYSTGRGKVVFRTFREADKTVFEVQDQGIGIPASDLPELFEPFHRGSNVSDIKGTGLGLTIVKKSVEMHGGDISVQSEPGHGTCFRVTLATITYSTA